MNIDNNIEGEDKTEKIQSLRDMIGSAERTIHSAKAMLLQIEGKKKVGRRKKPSEGEDNVVHGAFDGQTMIGTDGKQYPVPANYASKSKLVDGDSLKLTIGSDGAFMYKQIGPVPRQNKIGIVSQDEAGNYFIIADNNSFKVLLASITYFHAEPGDEVAMVTSSEEPSQWATIESVLRSGSDNTLSSSAASSVPSFSETKKNNIVEENDLSLKDENADSIMDEWVPNISEIEKEINAEMKVEPARSEV
ncbi:MAG: hypothetical protein KAT32_01575 [Candidatus Moranbacteria bacterium]|nr:hypothetical protein [Candidatus Moranbacteria bacterium]